MKKPTDQKTVRVTRTSTDPKTGAKVTETVVQQVGQSVDAARPPTSRGPRPPTGAAANMTPKELADEIWALRIEGASYREIGQTLGISADRAHKIQLAELAAAAEARKAELRSYSREQELARLDAQQAAADKIINWTAGGATLPPSHREVTAAIRVALQVQEQRARLLDLYAPEVVEHRHSGHINLELQVAQLAPLLAQLPEDQWVMLGQIHQTLAQLQATAAPVPDPQVPGLQ